jgi:hypothetical protein
MLYRYNTQGALGRLRQSHTSNEGPTETERQTAPRTALGRALDAAHKAFWDDAIMLKRAEQRVLAQTGKTLADVNIMDSPSRLSDALAMTAGKKVAHWVKNKSGDIPSLESIFSKVKGKEKDFTDYLVAVRNAQLIEKGKKAQLPLRDYSYSIDILQTANPEFRAVARELKLWTDQPIDYAVDAGAISREDATRIKDAYVVYLPFFRDIDGPRRSAGGRGVAERGSGLSNIEGSGFEIRDPMMALQEVATTIVTRAHQNMVMGALYKMAVGHEAGGLATVVSRDVVPKDHPVKAILDAMEKKMGSDELGGLFETLREVDAIDPQTITLFSQKVIPTGTKSIVAFTPRLTEAEIGRVAMDPEHRSILEKQQGKLQWLEIDKDAYEVLMGIDKMPTLGPLDIPVIREILRFPAAMTRFFATGFSPKFTVANIPRDVLSYSVFSQKGEFAPLSGFSQWAKGFSEYIAKGGSAKKLYEELGARTSSFYSEGAARKMFGQATTVTQKSKQYMAELIDRAKNVLEAPENFLRLQEFKDIYDSAKARGASEIEARMLALEAAREITVNFARAGTVSRFLNQMIPYFNAAMQGHRKMWRQLAVGGDGKTDAERARIQRAAFGNALVSITAPSLFLWWLNHEEEWYQDLPQWRKSLFFNFKIFDQPISIPKPFELGVLFGSIPEAIADSFYIKGKPVEAKTLLRDTFLGYLDGPAALIPAFIKPLIEGQFNFKSFYNRRLTPEWIEKGRIPEEQATFYTTETAKILSKAIGGKFTPIEIEHYLGGYTAGTTTTTFKMIDELTGLKDHPGWEINPFERLTSQELHGQSRFVDELYDLSTTLDQKEGSDRIQGPELQLKRDVDAAKKQISALRKSHQQGRISRDEANRRAYKIARPLVERSEK